MKESIEKLKSYFETGDRPTQIEFESLIDSFLHKDDGVAIKNISLNAEGNIVFAFSDKTEQIIAQSSSGLPDGFVEDIQNALDKKVDKVTGKQLSAEDFTSLLKTKLEQLENYEHPEFHQINEVENLQGILDSKIGKVDVTTAALHGLEVRDANGITQFTTDEFVEFEGVSFDSIAKRIQFSSLSLYTIYVDGTNGDDATAQLYNREKPFKTFSAAKAQALPGVYTYHFLSSIVLDSPPTSSTYFYSDRAITIDFSNISGRISGGTWYYYAPLSEFRHINTGSENPITFFFSNCHIVADRITINSNSDGANNFLFDASANGNSSAIANKMTFGDSGGNRIRGCFKHYQVTCNIFTFSNRQYLTDSADTGFYDINTLVVSGTIGTQGIFPTAKVLSFKKMRGGTINWYGLYDDSKVFRENARIYLRGNVDLTGHSKPGNTGDIIIFDNSFDTLNIFSFYGKIGSRAAGNYAVYAGTKLNAKIKIYNSRIEAVDDFLRHNPNSDNTNKEIIIKDSEFIFDASSENIFKDTGTGINVIKIGTMLSNGGLGANVTINTTKLNSF